MTDMITLANGITIAVGLGSLIGGIFYGRKQGSVVSSKERCGDCDLIQAGHTREAKEMREEMKKEHQENREDHKEMFHKMDKITESIFQTKCVQEATKSRGGMVKN